MDIDDDGVTDPTTEFGDLFEGQTVAFENELVGHDADDMLGAISHDLGLSTSSHHRSHHPSDHDILAANLNFVPDDYLHGQQMVMDHDPSEYSMTLPDVTGIDGQQNLQNHQQMHDTTGGVNQQIYIHSTQSNPQINADGSTSASMSFEYNFNQVQQEILQAGSNNVVPDVPVPEEPKVKTKMKVVKDVEYFTKENMEQYLRHRGFISKRGEVETCKSITKAVLALNADSEISSEHFRRVSFGSKYESEYVIQEMERFWKFYLSRKSKDVSISLEFLPMLIPMLLHFYFEMMFSYMYSIARRICVEFSKKFHHEDKSQEHYDLLVAVMKITSLEMLKTDSILSPLVNRKCEFTLSENALGHLRRFLSKSKQPILIDLFTNRFKINTRESKELVESFDWDNLDTDESSSDSDSSSDEHENDNELVLSKRKFIKKTIEDVRNSAVANLPMISVYTTGDNPICGNISKKGTFIAYGLAEAGIRLCTKEYARNIERIDDTDPRPTDPETYYGIKSVAGHAGTVYGLHFHPRSKLLFSVGQDSFMRAWNLSTDNPSCQVIYRGHSGPIWRLDMPDTGSMIATAGVDSTARIFIPEKSDFVRVMAGHYCSVNTVKFHPNEAYIATGSADKSVRLWSVSDGNIVRMFTGSDGSVNCVAFHESGKYLAGAGENSKIIIWDLAEGEVVTVLDSLPNCRDLEFRQNMLSACFRNGMLQVFNLRRIFGGYADYDDSFESTCSTAIPEPFTTQCFAKTLFKLHYMDSGRIFCLGSDVSVDADDLKATESATENMEAEMVQDSISQTDQLIPSDTILQQVLQTSNPPQATSVKSETTGRSKKQSGIVTVMGSNGSSRILAARLAQPITNLSYVSSSGDVGDTGVAISNESPVSVPVETSESTPSVPMQAATTSTDSSTAAPTTTQQMITSAELDAAIASVIDQSGGDNSDGGGTITMYASS